MKKDFYILLELSDGRTDWLIITAVDVCQLDMSSLLISPAEIQLTFNEQTIKLVTTEEPRDL